MKKVTVFRGPSTDEGTFGTFRLESNGALEWHSLELPDRDNLPRVSSIPAGTYIARLAWSEHFQRQLYHLQNVPGRDAVEIHPANFAGDVSKGFRSDLLGCVTLGTDVGELQVDGHPQRAVLNSKIAFEEFMTAAAGEDLEISIEAA